MKKIYHRTKVNEDLLNSDRFYSAGAISGGTPMAMPPVDLSKFLQGSVSDTLPKGNLIGIYFLNYIELTPNPNTGNLSSGGQAMAMPNPIGFLTSHTNIRIEDTRGRLVTEPTDIRDYERKNWNAKGYKEISLDLESNEQITINYETIGDSFPICGEFIFVIEDNSCEC